MPGLTLKENVLPILPVEAMASYLAMASHGDRGLGACFLIISTEKKKICLLDFTYFPDPSILTRWKRESCVLLKVQLGQD
jgi:hypothetical protein